MKEKTRETVSGQVPGSGHWQKDTTLRPDDPSLVACKQLSEMIGVSNPSVVSAAIKRLGIRQASWGQLRRSTYNNGGSALHAFNTPYYDSSIAGQIRDELHQNSATLANGKFSYEGKTFSWTSS